MKSELSAVSAFARSCMARTLPMDSRLPFSGMVGARQAEVKVSISSTSMLLVMVMRKAQICVDRGQILRVRSRELECLFVELYAG